MTNKEVLQRFIQIKEKFPDGMYWNHDPLDKNDPNSVRYIPCEHHHTTGCSVANGSCGCNYFGGGIQCYGFALYIAQLIFGCYPQVGTNPDISNGSVYSATWRLYSMPHTDITLEPGDIIRKDNHSAIVCNMDGDKVTVGEVWSSHGCKIKWGFFNGDPSNSSIKSITSTATYILKAPKTLDESDIEYYTVKKGDSWWGIAYNKLGNPNRSVYDLVAYNERDITSTLMIGEVIKIPPKDWHKPIANLIVLPSGELTVESSSDKTEMTNLIKKEPLYLRIKTWVNNKFRRNEIK